MSNTILKLNGPPWEGKNRIHLVGVELEGVWATVPKGSRIVKDTSVKDFPTKIINEIASLGTGGIGEISSPAMLPADVAGWVKKNFPKYTNASCGLHLHMSFASCDRYSTLMDIRYHDTIMEQIRLWGVKENLPADHILFQRLSGDSVYCQKKFWPDKQVLTREKIYDKNKEGHRYTDINYCHGLLGTLEIRVLPMFPTPEQCVRALQMLMDVTNECLVKLYEKRRAEREAVVFEGVSSQYVDRARSRV